MDVSLQVPLAHHHPHSPHHRNSGSQTLRMLLVMSCLSWEGECTHCQSFLDLFNADFLLVVARGSAAAWSAAAWSAAAWSAAA
eukprot:3049991-Amphidinium_carterae.1